MDGMKPIGATDQSELPKNFKLGRVSTDALYVCVYSKYYEWEMGVHRLT